MTFKEYLSKRQARGNPQGDFVRDARSDTRMPDVTSWQQLKAYLQISGACPEAVAAGRLVWSAYQQRIRGSS